MANKFKPTSLQIAFWNARGLVMRDKKEIIHFLEEHDIDILLVNETWLKPQHKVNFPNYSIYRTDRLANKGGGTAVIIKSKIDHCPSNRPSLATPTFSPNIEETTVLVNTKNYGLIQFTSIYIPPNKNPTPQELQDLLDPLFPTSIIAGDFNAKHRLWNCPRSDYKGNNIFQFTQDTQSIVVAPSETTIRTLYSPFNVLDFAILRNTSYIPIIRALDELNSDHKPVLLYLGDPVDPFATLPDSTRYKVSWEDFGAYMEEHLTPRTLLTDEIEIDSAIADLTTTIQEALKAASTPISPDLKHRLDLPKPIRLLITERNRNRKLGQETGDPAAISKAKELKKIVRKEIRRFSEETWVKKLEDLVKGSHPYWSLTKILRVKKCPITPLDGPRGPVYSTRDKCELFADSIEDQFTPNPIAESDSDTESYSDTDSDSDSDTQYRDKRRHIKSINREARAIVNATPSPPPPPMVAVTIDETEFLIKRLRNRKAPGIDGISNRTLKKLTDTGVEYLTNILNACLEQQYFPDSWKNADIILLPKPGKNLKLPQNHRPISLLPTMSKILERAIKSRLQITIDEKKLIPDEQHGFRKGHSTNHQLLRTTEYIKDALNHRKFTTGLFLDIAKAFDKVWIEGLIVKLSRAEIELPMIKILNSFLTRRQFSIKYHGIKSSIRRTKAGVPQGSVLAPILYNLYTRDIPIPSNTYARSCIVAQYADDTAILARSIQLNQATKLVQLAANQIVKWCDKWRIKLNASKSEAIIFRHRGDRLGKTRNQLVMSKKLIPWSTTVKYLGLHLDKNLTFFKHINSKDREARIVKARLTPMLGRRSKVSMRGKLLLHTAIIRPIMTYACPIWAHGSPNLIKKLQVVQNLVLRSITGAPNYVRNKILHRDLEMETLEEHIGKLAIKFYASMDNHPNATIKNLNDYDENTVMDHDRPRSFLRRIKAGPSINKNKNKQIRHRNR
jgi:hypothetical protein